MEDIHQHTSAIAAICTLIGLSIPIIFKAAISFVRSKQAAAADEFTRQFAELRTERNALNTTNQGIMTDLQKQIFDLREQLVALRKENLTYVQENAELKAKIMILTADNEDLKNRIIELESEIHKLHLGQAAPITVDKPVCD